MPLDIWAIWPTVSTERSNEISEKWIDQGYHTAVLIEKGSIVVPDKVEIVFEQDDWTGFPDAINSLCKLVPGDIMVCIGDDVYPDPNHRAEEIGEQFQEVFPNLFGVMQPTGDRYGSIDDCCVCPWVGRKFIEDAYNGLGPYWGGYFHYFSDAELQEVAKHLGAFQQRRDLCQYHDHWGRKEGVERPEHLMEAGVQWRKDRYTYKKRKAKNFPGCEFTLIGGNK